MDKFSDGSQDGYVELPVKAAWLNWTRGEAKLRALIATDPGLFFGGWRAFVTNKEGEANPVLPIPIVERVSEDGKHPYKVYAANALNFLPIQHRTRYELKVMVKDEQTGREFRKIAAVSKEKIQGYSPSRQVFGLVFADGSDEYAPAVVKVDKWSAFISFERAGQIWNKVKAPSGSALIRRYGSIGNTKGGDLMPTFEVFGQSRSTPIEAIDPRTPRFFQITPELDDLYEQSVAWKNCERWNASGKVEEVVESAMQKFLARAEDMYLTNVEIEQIVKENNGDYAAALSAIEENATLVDFS